MKKFLFLFFMAMILVGAGIAGYLMMSKTKRNPDYQRQAIFLTNGQVYFGEIESLKGNYLILKNIYYLKTPDQINGTQENSTISIIKLGEEIHGPEDKMYINKENLLFYENMKNDSKINEAIKSFLTKSNTK